MAVLYDDPNIHFGKNTTRGPFVVPDSSLVGMTRIDYTVTVDDYTLDPPTEAAFMATIDLSDDGITWKTVVSMWAGISCIHVGSIAIGGKKVRVTAQTQGIASVISLHAEAF